jgi:DNA-binding NarL/FixJ family response regulator
LAGVGECRGSLAERHSAHRHSAVRTSPKGEIGLGIRVGAVAVREFQERIRSIAPATKVIMVTANTDPLLAREALGLGALAYVERRSIG